MTRRIKRSAAAATVALVAVGGVAVGAASTASAASRRTASALAAKVTGTAEGMSQPSTFVTVTNTSDTTCTLRGYPTIVRVRTATRTVATSVTPGAVMNAPHVKVTTVTLKPGGKAWFAFGTAVAYDPPVVTLRRIVFAPGADEGDHLRVRISQQASAPSGKPFPVGVTAWAKGTQTGDQ